MRTIVFLILLGVNAFVVSGFLHSNVTYVLSPGELRNFYLPEQTGSISLKITQGFDSPRLNYGASCRESLGGIFTFDDPPNYACVLSDTNDWYIFLYNENISSPLTVTFEVEVYETIVIKEKSVDFSLSPYNYQYFRIPAEINHGLSFNFDIQCQDGNNFIDLWVKSTSTPKFYSTNTPTTLWENEDIFLLVQNDHFDPRNCTLSITSKATVVLNNGLNTLIVDNSTGTIGTRYTPTSASRQVLKFQVDPPLSIAYDDSRAYSYFNHFFTIDGQKVQNFVLDTSSMTNGDQINVTVTPITTNLLTSAVSHTFSCVNGDHHVFALIGTANSGAVLQVTQMDGLASVFSYYATEESPIPNEAREYTDPYTQYIHATEFHNVVWVLEAVCNQDGNANLTASLPVFQTLSIGKNIIHASDTDIVYAILPQGPDQSSLGVHVNSSNASGEYYAGHIESYTWSLNPNQYTDVPPEGSPVNVTATFASVSSAVNGVVDFSRGIQPDEKDVSYYTFLFPAMKRHNSIFLLKNSSGANVMDMGIEGMQAWDIDIASFSVYISSLPDSIAAFVTISAEQGSSVNFQMESIANIGLCNGQFDCNGHGTCQPIADQCSCTDGYSGDWCDVTSPSDDNNNSGAESLMVIATCQLLLVLHTILFMF